MLRLAIDAVVVVVATTDDIVAACSTHLTVHPTG